MKTVFLFLISLFLTLAGKSQNAPVAAIPSNENKLLIDSLIKITKYKEYFISYCDRQIDNIANKNNWEEDRVRQKKLSVSFDEFKKYTMYNWFSSLSKEDINDLITIFQKINKGKYSSFLFTHSGIQSNLELFVKRYLE